MRYKWVLVFASCWPFAGNAQVAEGRIILPAKIVNGDTIPIITLPPFDVIAPANPDAYKNMQRYNKLRRDVRKTYPYARLAAAKLEEINANIGKYTTERQRRLYVKSEEKKLKEEFEDQLTNLTVTQGVILIKLIDRETGHTSYALVKELRGSLQAFFWQGLARIFGHNLKAEYDASGEDKDIEVIVKELESEKK